MVAATPLVLVLEDLHWADQSSRELISFLAVRLRAQPLLLIGTLREEELDGPTLRWLAELERRPRVRRLRLARLADTEIAEVVADLLTGGRARRLAAVIAGAEGNPLYARELARAEGARPPVSIANAVPSPGRRGSHAGDPPGGTRASLRRRRRNGPYPACRDHRTAGGSPARLHQGGRHGRAARGRRRRVRLPALPNQAGVLHRVAARRAAPPAPAARGNWRCMPEAEPGLLAQHWHFAGCPGRRRPRPWRRHGRRWRPRPTRRRPGASGWRSNCRVVAAGPDGARARGRGAGRQLGQGPSWPSPGLGRARRDRAGAAAEPAAADRGRLLEQLDGTTGRPATHGARSGRRRRRWPSSRRRHRRSSRPGRSRPWRPAWCSSATTTARAVGRACGRARGQHRGGRGARPRPDRPWPYPAQHGDLDGGLAALAEASALARKVGSVKDIVHAASNWMYLLCTLGRFTEALDVAERAPGGPGARHAPGAVVDLRQQHRRGPSRHRAVGAGRPATGRAGRRGERDIEPYLWLLQLELAVGQGDHARVAELLVALSIAPDDPRLAGPLHACLAEHELNSGVYPAAAAEVTAGLAVLDGADLADEEIRLLAAAARLAADLAAAASGLAASLAGRWPPPTTTSRAAPTPSRAATTAAGLTWPLRGLAAAERARQCGADDRATWRRAAEAWRRPSSRIARPTHGYARARRRWPRDAVTRPPGHSRPARTSPGSCRRHPCSSWRRRWPHEPGLGRGRLARTAPSAPPRPRASTSPSVRRRYSGRCRRAHQPADRWDAVLLDQRTHGRGARLAHSQQARRAQPHAAAAIGLRLGLGTDPTSAQ